MHNLFTQNVLPISLTWLFEAMPVAMTLIDREGRMMAVNNRMASLSGLSKDTLLGRTISEFSKEGGVNIARDFAAFDKGENVLDHDIRIGDNIYAASVEAVRDAEGYAVGEMVTLTDISNIKETERKLVEANEALQTLASRDPLTGIYNCRSFYEICDKLMAMAHRENSLYSALFIDIDHFKKVNDTYGHQAGDEILRSVTSAIQEEARTSDVMGRVGGEEFSVFLPKTNKDGALGVAEKLRALVQGLRPRFEGVHHNVTISIGVAARMEHHKSITDLLRDADHAMYHAKMHGRNKVYALEMPCYVGRRMPRMK